MAKVGEVFRDDGAAKHGRPKVIYCGIHHCDTCGCEVPALGFDHSDEEYGEIWVCRSCIEELFDHGKKWTRATQQASTEQEKK